MSQASPPRPRRLPLFTVPCAGGVATTFRTLPETLGRGVHHVPYELPGRGFRSGEPLCRTVDRMLDDLGAVLDRETGDGAPQPYLLLGHALGARLAYLAAARRKAAGAAAPARLLLGGETPPECAPWHAPVPPLDGRFQAEAVARGWYPEELFRRPEPAAEILPALHADLAAFEGFRPVEWPRLDCPVTVFVPIRDADRREDMALWERYTTGPFDIKTVPGGPFFYLRQMPALGKVVADAMRSSP